MDRDVSIGTHPPPDREIARSGDEGRECGIGTAKAL